MNMYITETGKNTKSGRIEFIREYGNIPDFNKFSFSKTCHFYHLVSLAGLP